MTDMEWMLNRWQRKWDDDDNDYRWLLNDDGMHVPEWTTTEIVFSTSNKNIKKEEKKEMLYVPEITKVVFEETKGTTMIFWGDGTRTVVTNHSDAPMDRYAGFCAAVCKKLFGSTTNVISTMNKYDVAEQAKAQHAKKVIAKEAAAKTAEALRKEKEKTTRTLFNDLVDEYIMEEEARRKAIAIVNAREQRKAKEKDGNG